MKSSQGILGSILLMLVVIIVFFVVRLNQTPKNLPPLIPIASPTPHPKVTCKRFTNLGDALKHIDIACVLDLSGQHLTSVPSEIIRLQKVTEIDLANNNLTSLPIELFSLPKLVKLDVRNNQISTFPKDLGIQDHMQELLITGNSVTKESIQEKFIGTHIYDTNTD